MSFLLMQILQLSAVAPAFGWVFAPKRVSNLAAVAFSVACDGDGDVVAVGGLESADHPENHADFTILKLSGSSGRESWRSVIRGSADPSDGTALNLALDDHGDAIAVGSVINDETSADFIAVKVSGASGLEDWRYTLARTTSQDQANAIALAGANGRVGVVGSTREAGVYELTAAMLAGSNGVQQWLRDVPGNGLSAAIDADGNLIGAGSANGPVGRRDFFVIKLAATDGVELWRREIDSSVNYDEVRSVAVDHHGDVLATGGTGTSLEDAAFTIVKLDGGTGTVRWRQDLQGNASNNYGVKVTFDGNDDAIVAGIVSDDVPPGTVGQSAVVRKLGADDGAELWRWTSTAALPGDVKVDAAGDVILGGRSYTDRQRMMVVKIEGASGTELWRRDLEAARDGYAVSVAIDGQGDVVAAGGDFTIVKLHGRDGTDFVDPCGNGQLDPGEGCDDGNTASGDCCSPTCQLTSAGSACDDGDACTDGDACRDGACAGTPITCPSCQTCDPRAGCIDAPRTACHQPAKRSGGQLELLAEPTKALTWRWVGEGSTHEDFGDPTGGDRYALCIFDESGPTPKVTLRATTRSGQCQKRPCWRQTRRRAFHYEDAARTPDGLEDVLLKAGKDGKAHVSVSGRGRNLALPPLPLLLPMRVQFQAENGQCWEARYSDEGVAKNNRRHFKAKTFAPSHR